ncbi:MAG: hypothetical protein H0V10_01205 [Geodermatophilaceae bacterium]|nr:hypothetical protein [Geodermatophilaceae bacterium]
MATERLRVRTIWSALVFLVLIVLVFAGLRVAAYNRAKAAARLRSASSPSLASGRFKNGVRSAAAPLNVKSAL